LISNVIETILELLVNYNLNIELKVLKH
jgi:hypothetical protein